MWIKIKVWWLQRKLAALSSMFSNLGLLLQELETTLLWLELDTNNYELIKGRFQELLREYAVLKAERKDETLQ